MAKMFRKFVHRPGHYHVLLIGAPRTGTTLLATMVGRHTEVGIVNEDVTGRGIDAVLGKQLTGNKLCVPNQIRLNRRSFAGERFLKRLGFVAEAPKSRYSIRDYLELPNLKVLAIIRDGTDSVSSMMARGKDRLKKAARRWGEAIETIYELKQHYSDRVLVVSFDELLLYPDKVMGRVCEFLGLIFQERMLDGYKYNPYYPETELKTEKAHGEKQPHVQFCVSDLVPPAHAKYQELLSQSQQASHKSALQR